MANKALRQIRSVRAEAAQLRGGNLLRPQRAIVTKAKKSLRSKRAEAVQRQQENLFDPDRADLEWAGGKQKRGGRND
jgi:hypothetical protein